MNISDFTNLAQAATQGRPPEEKKGISFNLSVTITLIVLAVQCTVIFLGLKDKINHDFMREWARQWKDINPTLNVPDVDRTERIVEGKRE